MLNPSIYAAFERMWHHILIKLENLTVNMEETDPTVPDWAKAETKPDYTAEEVGALPKDTPLFSGDYNDLENAPNISEDNPEELLVTDPDGNIIFRSGANGLETVQLSVESLVINGETIQDIVKKYIEEMNLDNKTQVQFVNWETDE